MNTALIVLGCVCVQTPQTAAIPKDQFLALVRQEAVPKWSTYTAMTEACEITYRYENHRLQPNGDIIPDHPNDKVMEATHVSLKDYGWYRKVTNLKNRKDSEEHTINCFNSKYSFELFGKAANKMAIRNVNTPLPSKDEVRAEIRAAVVARSNG